MTKEFELKDLFNTSVGSSHLPVIDAEADIAPAITQTLNDKTNCFITGPAGTGKSYIVNQVMRHTNVSVALTASTGIAAMNIGGCTIHSWSGINAYPSEDYLDKIIKKKNFYFIKVRIRSTQLLIIDEIGMMKAGQLDLLDAVCRVAKYGLAEYKNAPPFGGLQVVFTGDFLQIPPVTQGSMHAPYLWAFESHVWKKMMDEKSIKLFNLTKIHRQDNLEFQNILNNARIGKPTQEDIEILSSRSRGNVTAKGPTITPTRFVGTNVAVAQGNSTELSKATGKLHTFNAKIEVSPKFQQWAADTTSQLIACSKMENVLQVKIGMPVMMLINRNTEDETFVNGSMGIFKGVDKDGNPVVTLKSNGRDVTVSTYTDELKIDDDTAKASMEQYPFRLAHYMTFHKSQGLTLDAVEVNMAQIFNPGMAYVGLSRVKTLEGLTIRNFNPRMIRADARALRFYGIK